MRFVLCMRCVCVGVCMVCVYGVYVWCGVYVCVCVCVCVIGLLVCAWEYGYVKPTSSDELC